MSELNKFDAILKKDISKRTGRPFYYFEIVLDNGAKLRHFVDFGEINLLLALGYVTNE